MSRQASAQPTTTETDLVSAEQPTADVQPALRLRLVRPDNQRRVVWQADTVDNEHMGKKKSKCCCVYRKPRPFDESSSDEEDDCANCVGHRKPKPASADPQPDDGQAGASQQCGGQSQSQ